VIEKALTLLLLNSAYLAVPRNSKYKDPPESPPLCHTERRPLPTQPVREKLEERMTEEPGLKKRINQTCQTLRKGRKKKYQITKA
jgi:hypothetical protein